jgi:hypothetical protein
LSKAFENHFRISVFDIQKPIHRKYQLQVSYPDENMSKLLKCYLQPAKKKIETQTQNQKHENPLPIISLFKYLAIKSIFFSTKY